MEEGGRGGEVTKTDSLDSDSLVSKLVPVSNQTELNHSVLFRARGMSDRDIYRLWEGRRSA